jgi:hypothetical protein
MNISELITQLRKQIEDAGINLNDLNVSDDEDLIMFALTYLINNIEDAINLED